MRLAWLTDIHLDFVDAAGVACLGEDVRRSGAEAVLLTGDIAQAPTLEATFVRLAEALDRPAYFVLGNHDFYHGSIAGVRELVARLVAGSERLVWLTDRGVVPLTPGTALVGHDGWADGRLGLSTRSTVVLNDYLFIAEFLGLGARDRFALLNQLGDGAATALRPTLEEACRRSPSVLVLTHVPPFREACLHEGRISDDQFLPHFSSLVMGTMLEAVAETYPATVITVLCGHTHSPGFVRIRPNLEVRAGGAVYGAPEVQQVIEIGE
jgi:predicted phosphohydrolase